MAGNVSKKESAGANFRADHLSGTTSYSRGDDLKSLQSLSHCRQRSPAFAILPLQLPINPSIPLLRATTMQVNIWKDDDLSIAASRQHESVLLRMAFTSWFGRHN